MDWTGLMAYLTGADWGAVLLPRLPLLELAARGTLMYLGLVFLLRVVLKREAGSLSLTDLLLILLIAEAAQNGLTGGYQSVGDGLALVLVLLAWSYALDWLIFHVPAVARLMNPPRLELVREGQLLRRNLRREMITPDELITEVHRHGVADLAGVKAAYMEPDGQISVIAREQKADAPERKTKA
jgi:uncharacterized membrane protein YcaP (DUF421 family)